MTNTFVRVHGACVIDPKKQLGRTWHRKEDQAHYEIQMSGPYQLRARRPQGGWKKPPVKHGSADDGVYRSERATITDSNRGQNEHK